VLSAVHGPRWRLVLIGAGQLTRYLAEMARMLDYTWLVIDPREEYANAWELAVGADQPRHAGRCGARARARRPQRAGRNSPTIPSSTTWR